MMGLMTLLPTLLLMMTGFTRILIVLNFLKQALGTQTAPPAQLIAALALLLTGFVMAPTLNEVNRTAIKPWMDGTITQEDALSVGSKPFRVFMLKQVRRQDVETFVRISKTPPPATMNDVPMVTLTSAFVISDSHRVPDWLRAVPAVHHHRRCGELGPHEHGHVHAPARDDLTALQAAAVRARRRMVADRSEPHHELPLMSHALVVDLARNAIMLALLIAGPMLVVALLVGLAVSLLQAVTQIQEQTLAFVPKLVGVSAVFLIALPWVIQLLVKYTTELFRSIPTMVS